MAGFWGWEDLKGGQWEEKKAWRAPNGVKEKRGCHLQEDPLPSPCYARCGHLGHPPSLGMLPLSLAAPDRVTGPPGQGL